jgi:predicted PurR-regulated permease PerM
MSAVKRETNDGVSFAELGRAMTTPSDHQLEHSCDRAALAAAGVALALVLWLHLLPSLLAGLLVYESVHILAPRLHIVHIRDDRAKLAAVALLALGVVLVLALFVVGIVAFVQSESGSLPALLAKMADVLESWRTTMPAWIVAYLPPDVDGLRDIAVTWLRDHAGTVQHAGAEAGRVLAHLLVGVGIGALVALADLRQTGPLGPLGKSLEGRVTRLGDAFRRVVFGQIRISAINTVLTGLFLVVALPIAGIQVPLAKTMIAVTFVVGLLPVLGNLISNTAIVVLSLSVSLTVAVTALVFLVVIHKLEYFLNAHIVGTQVRAHAWELLTAMLVMEAAFGIPGLVAAPIYYAYLKDELVSRGLI